MSNQAFDKLDRAVRIQQAKEAVVRWEQALVDAKAGKCGDVTEADLDFIQRSIVGAKRVLAARRAIRA